MKIERRIYYMLSPKMRLFIRRIFYLPSDVLRSIAGKRYKYEPPRGSIYVGSGDFIRQGIHQLSLLKEHIMLKPDDAVLDVGSGIGRTAVALTSYLNGKGRYEGFDVVEKGVKWCNNKIKRDFPNFNFLYVPLKNDLYNQSTEKAENFKFPYEDHSFDKVFLFSVFTHMSVSETGNYLREIKRVLKSGGLCLSTFFVYTSSDEERIATNNQFSFPVKKENYRLMSNEVQSANIALNEGLLNELIRKAELEKIKTIHGYWKEHQSKSGYNDFQDIVVLKA